MEPKCSLPYSQQPAIGPYPVHQPISLRKVFMKLNVQLHPWRLYEDVAGFLVTENMPKKSEKMQEENVDYKTNYSGVLRHNQPPITWVSGTLTPEVKRPGREADHSPPSSAEVHNV
jgi:hypothetical protein